MSRHLIVLNIPGDRALAAHYALTAPEGTRIEFKAAKRTVSQNDLMWSHLTDISRRLAWHGVKLTPNDWKLLFLDALKRETRIVSNLDGDGFVNLNRSSDLSKSEMNDLIALIRAFGANHGITFIDQRGEDAA